MKFSQPKIKTPLGSQLFRGSVADFLIGVEHILRVSNKPAPQYYTYQIKPRTPGPIQGLMETHCCSCCEPAVEFWLRRRELLGFCTLHCRGLFAGAMPGAVLLSADELEVLRVMES